MTEARIVLGLSYAMVPSEPETISATISISNTRASIVMVLSEPVRTNEKARPAVQVTKLQAGSLLSTPPGAWWVRAAA